MRRCFRYGSSAGLVVDFIVTATSLRHGSLTITVVGGGVCVCAAVRGTVSHSWYWQDSLWRLAMLILSIIQPRKAKMKQRPLLSLRKPLLWVIWYLDRPAGRIDHDRTETVKMLGQWYSRSGEKIKAVQVLTSKSGMLPLRRMRPKNVTWMVAWTNGTQVQILIWHLRSKMNKLWDSKNATKGAERR